jgi:adenine-specific DNA-methyltransferase
MEKITADSPEARSADLVADNIAALKGLFPELVTESAQGTAINVDVLKQLVGDQTVTDTEEKYGLNWHGKRQARQLALKPSLGTLRPCPEESQDWDTTQNILIEGDNLEVLKLLQKSYAGKVKLIYIDPPYNRGKDFVYPDDFRDNTKNYLDFTGQNQNGISISSNTESSGRFHTKWLNMMIPRLKLARQFLTDDGVMFVSIDDGEVNSLRAIVDEVFGGENFIAQFVWEKRTTRENRRVFSFNHEYVICVAKNKPSFEQSRNLLPNTEEVENRYRNLDNDPRGPWQSVSLNAQAGHATKDQFYTITTPGGSQFDPPPGRCWSVTEKKLKELIADNRIWFGSSGNNVPRTKLFLSESRNGLTPHTLWAADEVGTNDSAKKALIELFGGIETFDTPKPVGLLQRIIEISSDKSDIVMDFFAGCGTTAEAVYETNLKEESGRRHILVQLPEVCEIEGFDHLADIAKERLRRAAAKIKEENPLFSGDLGFRVFKLDSSNIKAWDPEASDLAATLEEHAEHLKRDRSEDDILYELLLKLGLDLCVPMEARTIVGKTVHGIGGGVLMVCLAEIVTAEEVEALALGIAEWHRALAPATDVQCVFRDSAFADDVAKTNLTAILEQHGLKKVRSL